MSADPTITQWLLDNLWVPATGIFGTVWGFLNMRIVRVEKTADEALPKEEFTGHQKIVEQQRQETRADMKELVGKVDALGHDMNEKFNTLTTIILKQNK